MPVETKQVETFHKRKDGSIFHVDAVGRQMWFGDTPLHVAFVRDNSERKRTEESLQITQFSFDHATLESIASPPMPGYWRSTKKLRR
jgi:hypothetical protein